MQAHPPIPPPGARPHLPREAAPFAPTPTILPGPIILLALLPAIPLLLFSLGARPPDTSALPFGFGEFATNNDLLVTTTLVCLAGGTVLFLGVYPEVGGRVWGWIRDGGEGGGGGLDWSSWWEELGMGEVGDWVGGLGGQSQMVVEQVRAQSAVPRRSEPPPPEWIWDERLGRWMRQPPPPPLLAMRPSSAVPITSRMMAHRHVLALREFQPEWYSPHQKPKLIPSLIIIAFIVFLVIILVGNFLKSVYTSESSSSATTTLSGRSSSSGGAGSSSGGNSKNKLPAWVERELRKRKAEKPEETSKRVEKEDKEDKDKAKKVGKDELEKWGKKRDTEKGVLRKELEKRRMPLTGLEKDTNKDESRKEKGREKEKKDDVSEEGGTKEKEGKGSKIKRLLLGEKVDKTKGTRDGTWELADPGVAEVTIASSTANAQKEAERLKAGG